MINLIDYKPISNITVKGFIVDDVDDYSALNFLNLEI
jgi:hypothetical protein